MSATHKKIYTIAPHVGFLEALVEGLWQQAEGDNLKLSQGLILMPTRRACRHLRDAFLKKLDVTSALLPKLQPLGDTDEDDFSFDRLSDGQDDLTLLPAISPLRRQLLLTQLIQKKDPEIAFDQSVQLAEALARFLDQVQIEECSLTDLKGLVKNQELAKHWQEIVQFLDILTHAWPAVLAAEGCLDPIERRTRLLKLQAAHWRKHPPSYPIFAAGSTGSMKATAELLDVIATLPQGGVILPGLDQDLDVEAWQAITDSHPQFGMKAWLEKVGVERQAVTPWGTPTKPTARVRLLQESMRPAEVTEAWRDLNATSIPFEAVQGLTRLDLDHPQQEAQVIALRMREVLETPKRTAMLVTPDRALAERVRWMLTRWQIEVNDSAGTSLATEPVGAFMASLLAASNPDAGAVDYLTLLKHPLTASGFDPGECRGLVRHMEMTLWRTSRPEASKFFEHFRYQLQPLASVWKEAQPLKHWLKTHIHVAETFAATQSDAGWERLWCGAAGEEAATWLNDWQEAVEGFPPLTGAEYEALFLRLMRNITVRPAYGQQPRLSILGPLEARLIQADLVILGGLNEGVWPPQAVLDPWMSRPMKRDFKLPLPERRTGLAAHDFVQLASASEVMLTRAKRSGNAPTVPSRFLLQLNAVLEAVGYTQNEKDCLRSEIPWVEWADHLDQPLGDPRPCSKPQPRPPASQRPQRMSVTDIGTWRRNPYAIYAKYILKLRKLEDLDADIDAADRGIIIHAALEAFIKKYPSLLPPEARTVLLHMGGELFETYKDYPEVKAFWWPRFERIADWFIDAQEARQALGIKPQSVEVSGSVQWGHFTLEGRADRLDLLPNNHLEIIDYKTGSVPTQNSIVAGYEPQLPLLAYIAQQGGFPGLSAPLVDALSYWELKGGRSVAKQHNITKKSVQDLIDEAQKGLEALLNCFADPATPYEAVPKPRLQPRYNDYAHLSRLAEWGRTECDE